MCEAVLCEQLQDLKHKHEAAKKAAREAKKMEKNALRKRTRLIKVPLCLCVSAGRTFHVQDAVCPHVHEWQAAKGLSKADLQLLLDAKSKEVEEAGWPSFDCVRSFQRLPHFRFHAFAFHPRQRKWRGRPPRLSESNCMCVKSIFDLHFSSWQADACSADCNSRPICWEKELSFCSFFVR